MSAGTDGIRQNDERERSGFRCGVCRERHDRLPMSYSVKVPQAVAAIPKGELDGRVGFTLDQCVIDKRAFYIRWCAVGRRPHFEILNAAHPLAVEQKNGITMERVGEIAEWFLHPKL